MPSVRLILLGMRLALLGLHLHPPCTNTLAALQIPVSCDVNHSVPTTAIRIIEVPQHLFIWCQACHLREICHLSSFVSTTYDKTPFGHIGQASNAARRSTYLQNGSSYGGLFALPMVLSAHVNESSVLNAPIGTGDRQQHARSIRQVRQGAPLPGPKPTISHTPMRHGQKLPPDSLSSNTVVAGNALKVIGTSSFRQLNRKRLKATLAERNANVTSLVCGRPTHSVNKYPDRQREKSIRLENANHAVSPSTTKDYTARIKLLDQTGKTRYPPYTLAQKSIIMYLRVCVMHVHSKR